MATEIKFTVGLDSSGVAAGAKQAEKSLQGIGKAGQISAGQTAAAMRSLPAQFTDIATQLQGGASPFTVLLQQGGQIKDQFGGIGNALRGIGSLITPAAVGFGTLAAAVGAVGFGFVAGAKQAAELRDMLALTGNAAGLTADRLDDLTARVSAGSQQTVGQVREIAVSLASTGRTSAQVFDSQAAAIARIADLSGKAGKEIAATFAGQLEAPAKFAARLNETYNFLTVADFKRIQALEKGKKAAEAANLTNELLVKSLEGQRTQLGSAERAWDTLTKAISRAGKALQDIGKPDTTRDAIDAQFKRLQGLQTQLATNTQVGRGEAVIPGIGSQNDGIRQQIKDAQRRLFELSRQAEREQLNNEARSESAAETRAKIEDLQQGGEARKGPPVYFDVLDANDGRLKLLRAQEEGLSAIRDSADQYRSEFLRSEKEAYDTLAKLEDKQAEEDQQRTIRQSEFLQGLVDANQRASAELIADERERGLAVIELDRQIAERRIREAQLTGQALTDALGFVNEAAALSQIKLDNEIQARLKGASDRQGDALTESIADGILSGFRNGNSLAEIFLQELKAQFARTVLQPLIRPVVDAGNEGLKALLQGISAAFAPDAGLNPGAADFATGEAIRGRRASGGRVEPRSTYLVGERGPELLRMGSQGGSVIPNSALGGVALSPQIAIHIDARSDQAQVSQLVASGVQQGMRATMEQLRVMGVTR